MSSKSNGATVMGDRTNLPNPPRIAGRKRERAETDREPASLPKAVKAESGGYAHGAICRLRLHNFLTFDDVVLTPNPQLNVIVGPNGTGKSSIVCAMCLGLGGHPKLLGRAKEIKDFIKHGKEVGFVEISLHNAHGRDPIIRRTMKIQDNSSTWTLNGSSKLQKEIFKEVQNMNIQLDNHCQFLPQDMVVEFAKMNSYQLLEETEKAIGDKDMYESHVQLKSLKSGSQDQQRLLDSREHELTEELRKNQLLERDVERFRNRQEYMKTIRQLKMKKLWVEYEVCRSEFLTVKAKRKEAERKLRDVKHRYHPILDTRKEQEVAVTRFKTAEKEKATELHQKQRQVTAKVAELTSLEDELEFPRQELESQKKEEQTRRKNVGRFRKEIQSYKSELDKLESQESIQPRIAEKNARMREIQREIGRVGTEQQGVQMERQHYSDQIRRANDELRQMQDIRNQRLQLIRSRDSGTYQAIMWLKDNQHRFKQPILEPIALVVNIRDQRYAPQIEASLRGKDFFSFVAQNQEDQDAFLAEIKTRRKLKVNIVRAPPRPLSAFRPEVPLEDLRRYGFQQMIIDLIEAPDPILRYYCQYHGLHTIAVAGDLSPPQIERVIQEQRGLRRFFTSRSQYMVTKSRYADKSSVRNSDIRPAQALVASVDSVRKAELEREIREAEQSMAVFDTKYRELEARDTQLRQEDNRLRQEKNDLRKIADNRKKLQSNINTREAKLEQLLTSTFDLRAEEEKCEQAVEKIQCRRIKCIEGLHKLLEVCVAAKIEKVHIGLLRRSSEMKVSFLVNQYHQAKTALENAEQVVLTSRSREDSLKGNAQQLLRKAKDESGVEDPKDDPTLIGAFQNYPGEVDALEEMIHEYQAQAEMCMGTDESVVAEYDQRGRRIEALQEETEQIRSNLENQDKKMDELKKRWLEPLQKLIDEVINKRFQEYFKHMGCIGEVTLQGHEDFSKYAIQIRVKFRDSEELHVLDAQRQSGGERSVATMLYLMALQGITSCPFRVVDEINQGMDPVNERRVFDLIVKTASQQGTAQYFLLTPKLLQDLNYSEAVTVHSVHNGQEMVPFRQWNMTNFLG